MTLYVLLLSVLAVLDGPTTEFYLHRRRDRNDALIFYEPPQEIFHLFLIHFIVIHSKRLHYRHNLLGACPVVLLGCFLLEETEMEIDYTTTQTNKKQEKIHNMETGTWYLRVLGTTSIMLCRLLIARTDSEF